MKQWLKMIASMLAFMMLITVVSCASSDENSENDPSNTQGDSVQEPEPLPIDIFVDGTTEYTLVFEDENAGLADLVWNYVDTLKNKYGVILNATKASMAGEATGKEIVVGQARESAQSVSAQLYATGDFAMCLVDDDWVLTATNLANYQYLFEILLTDSTYAPEDGNLSLSSTQDFIYHDSAYADQNYAAYKKQVERTLSEETVISFFDYGSVALDQGGEMVYRLYVPSNYSKSKEYPLLVVLHGAGERGTDNEKHMCYMLDIMFNQKNSPLPDAIVLVPQCPSGQQWVDTPWASGNYSTELVRESDELAGVVKLVEELTFDYMIDEDRIYAMGLSMGGFGTWDLLMRHGDLFAAGIPICGGGDPDMAESLVDIPIYTFHGSADTTVPVEGTREMAQALTEAGSTVFTYVELEGMAHGIWDTVAAKADVINWLFAQSLADR